MCSGLRLFACDAALVFRFRNALLKSSVDMMSLSELRLTELRIYKFGGWGLLFNTHSRVAAEFPLIMPRFCFRLRPDGLRRDEPRLTGAGGK